MKDVTSLAAWTTDHSRVATVETGEVEAISEGSATITAFFGGKSMSTSVEVTEPFDDEDSFTQDIVALEISDKNIKIKTKQLKALQVYAVYVDGTKEEVTDAVLWQTNKSSVVDVEDGVVTAGVVGKAQITATLQGISVFTQVQVVKPKEVKSLAVATKNVSMKKGSEKEVTLTAIYIDGTKENVASEALWISKNENIVVAEEGTFVAINKGSTVVTAKYGNKYINLIVTVEQASAVQTKPTTPTKPASGNGSQPKPGSAYTVTGYIMDADGERVVIGLELESATRKLHYTALDRASGKFTFSNVPNGTYQVHLFYKDYQVESPDSIIVNNSNQEIKVQLATSTYTIEGRAETAEGTPIVGFTVLLEGNGNVGGYWLPTQEDGSFQLQGIAPGKYKLIIGSSDNPKATQLIEVVDSDQTDLMIIVN